MSKSVGKVGLVATRVQGTESHRPCRSRVGWVYRSVGLRGGSGEAAGERGPASVECPCPVSATMFSDDV